MSACGGRAAISGDDQPGGGTVSSSCGTGGAGGTLGTTNTGGSAHGGSGGQASTDWAACSAKDLCVLDAVGPCGPGCEPIALSQFIAINSVNVTAFERSKPGEPCMSAGCAATAPGAAQAPNYYAECVFGECQAFDVRLTELSACASSSGCYLRSGTTCCGCGSDTLIAVSSSANVEQVFCAPAAGCGADCAPPAAPNATAQCTNGHCQVDY